MSNILYETPLRKYLRTTRASDELWKAFLQPKPRKKNTNNSTQKLKNFQNKYVAIKESPLISKIAHRIGIQTKGSKTYSKLLTNYKNSKQRYAKTKDGMLPESTVRFVKDNALRKMKEKKQLIKKSTSKV